VTFVTLNVTLATPAAESFGDWTAQVPLPFVVHDAVPDAPALHAPVTTAPPTAAWEPFSIRIVTRAVQFGPFALADPSRSPTWTSGGGGGGGGASTVIETVAGALAVVPSCTRYVNESGPL
jgi:hypothetical protein